MRLPPMSLNRSSLRAALWAIALLTLLPCAARADDGVSLKASLREGLVMRYDVEAKLEVKGAKEPATVDQKLRLRLTVAHIGKDGALVRCKVETANVRAKEPGAEAAAFEWKEGDEAPADEPALPRLYRRLGAAMLEISLDERGVIQSVSGLDHLAEDGAQMRALGILAPEAAVRTLQPVFALDQDAQPRKAGEHWTWAQDVPLGAWTALSSTDFTLESLGGGRAKVRGITTITPRAPKGSETGPRLEVTAQSIKTEAEWDAAQGQLIRRSTASEVELTSTLALEKPIVTRSRSRSTVLITRAEGK